MIYKITVIILLLALLALTAYHVIEQDRPILRPGRKAPTPESPLRYRFINPEAQTERIDHVTSDRSIA